MMSEDSERLLLAENIAKLTGSDLADVLDLIRQEQPEALQYVDHNWVFDTATLENFVVLKLQKLVEPRLVERDLPQHFFDVDTFAKNPPTEGPEEEEEEPVHRGPDAVFPLSSPHPLGKRKLAPTHYSPQTPLDHQPHHPQPMYHSTQPLPPSSPPSLYMTTRGKKQIHQQADKRVEDMDSSSVHMLNRLDRMDRRSSSSSSSRVNPSTPGVKRARIEGSGMTPRGIQRSSPTNGTDTSKMKVAEVISNIKVYANPEKSNLRLICGLCNKYFRKRTEVVAHIRTHTGEKPLKCQYCDSRYAHPSNLRAHERRHIGAKPFACDFPGCSKAFTKSIALKAHIRDDHPKSDGFKCPQCDKSFKRKSYLDKHLASAHTAMQRRA